MRKSFFRGIPVFVAALVVIGSAAGAGPPAIATGTWDCRNSVFTIESERFADGNRIITWSGSGCVYAGDLTGTFHPFGTRIIKSDGSRTDHGGIVCTGCTLGGRTGDFTAAQTFRGESALAFEGTITVLSATGGLTGLRAVNHWQTSGQGAFGTYSYKYLFVP
jgi:hypothetical protein